MVVVLALDEVAAPAAVGVPFPFADVFELEEPLVLLLDPLKNHSVSLRSCCDAFCDSWCSRWFSSRSLWIVSWSTSFSSDSFRTNKNNVVLDANTIPRTPQPQCVCVCACIWGCDGTILHASDKCSEDLVKHALTFVSEMYVGHHAGNIATDLFLSRDHNLITDQSSSIQRRVDHQRAGRTVVHRNGVATLGTD